MVKFSRFDKVLMIATALFVSTDIILALCIGLVLPDYVTKRYYYHPDGKKYDFDKAALRCPCLYRVYPEGTEDNLMAFEKIGPHAMEEISDRNRKFASQDVIDMSPISVNKSEVIDKKAVKKRYCTRQTTKRPNKNQIYDKSLENDHLYWYLLEHPYLVSLSVPAYIDDSASYIFACAGIAMNETHVLAPNTCVKEDAEWDKLKLQYISVTFSPSKIPVIGHMPSNITGFTILIVEDLEAVRLGSFPEVNMNPDKTIISHLKYAISFGWDDEWYKKDPNTRSKHEKFTVERWSLHESDQDNKNFCLNEGCEKKIGSRILIGKCYVFLGVQTLSGTGCGTFSGLTSNPITNKECTPIKKCGKFPQCEKIERDKCHRTWGFEDHYANYHIPSY